MLPPPLPPVPPLPPPGTRRRPWPWVAAGCGGFILLGFLVLFPIWALGRWGGGGRWGPGTAARRTYVNVRANLPAEEQSQFVSFRFDYPARFVAQPRTSRSVIKVDRHVRWGLPHDEVSFAVCSVQDPTPEQGHAAHYARLVEALRAKFKQGARFREFASMPETVDGVVGQSLCLESETDGELMRCKFIVLLPADGQNGVMIIMVATRFAAEIKTPLDLGQVGDTAEILRSFRWQE